MLTLATIVDWQALGLTVVASLIAGVGIIVAFSVAIYGGARFADLQRSGRTIASLGAGALMIVGLATSIGGCVVGLIVVISG
jgi:hypothetical protein